MALFGNNRESQRMSAMREAPKPVEKLEMLIEYYDHSIDTISITYNLETLQHLVASSFKTGASMNFSSANPPFAINPRWVKKVTFTKRQ
ncbi:thiopurine S-methyltransferase [Streptococcus anginosus]|uniref:thiopurine S-methyltransferase n=1 Tax=Streptococcus anginosus TaxID=1328 RepID=UPI0022E7F83D|nr:thiopurine S-methyltransferase [Streptococcus anginosus]